MCNAKLYFNNINNISSFIAKVPYHIKASCSSEETFWEGEVERCLLGSLCLFAQYKNVLKIGEYKEQSKWTLYLSVYMSRQLKLITLTLWVQVGSKAYLDSERGSE